MDGIHRGGCAKKMAVLHGCARVLRAGALQQNHGLHAPRGNVSDFVAETPADRLAARRADRPLPRIGRGHGSVEHVVGALSPGHGREAFRAGFPAERLLVASHAVWFYLGKLFWPVDLAFSYPLWTLHPGNPLAYGWLLAGIALCYAIYRAREDIDRSAEVAALYFVATLSPMLGFIMLYTFRYSFVADHYQYAASLGPIALVSAAIVTLAELHEKIRKGLYAAATVIVIALGALTWNECHIWPQQREDSGATPLRKNPKSLMAFFNLANDLWRAMENSTKPCWHYDRGGGNRSCLRGCPDQPRAEPHGLGQAGGCPGGLLGSAQARSRQRHRQKTIPGFPKTTGRHACFTARLCRGRCPITRRSSSRLLPDDPRSHMELGAGLARIGTAG